LVAKNLTQNFISPMMAHIVNVENIFVENIGWNITMKMENVPTFAIKITM